MSDRIVIPRIDAALLGFFDCTCCGDGCDCGCVTECPVGLSAHERQRAALGRPEGGGMSKGNTAASLVEQARDRSVKFTPDWPNTARLLAGLADAVERLQAELDDAREHWRGAAEEANRLLPILDAANHRALHQQGEADEARARVAALEAELAECYRLTGADPDGNEDWRLAPHAVREVARLRREADEDSERVAALEAGIRGYVAASEALQQDNPSEDAWLEASGRFEGLVALLAPTETAS